MHGKQNTQERGRGFVGIVLREDIDGKASFIVHDGKRTHPVKDGELDGVVIGESVTGIVDAKGELERISRVPDLFEQVERTAMISSNVSPPTLEPSWDRRLNSPAQEMARKLLAAVCLKRPITVRFHSDADGVSGALAIKKFMKAVFVQQNSAIYSKRDAESDCERMGQERHPLLVLIDFGSGQESEEGLAIAKTAGIEIISMDHHPPYERSAVNFSLAFNPWLLGCQDGSWYPGGLLTSMVAQAAGYGQEELGRIACAGDRSDALRLSKADYDKALALDYAATYGGFGKGIDAFAKIISDNELLDSVLVQANGKLEQARARIMKAIKKRVSGRFEVYLLDLDYAGERKEFPSKGKIAGMVFDIYEPKGPAVAIGYFKRTVVLRVSGRGVDAGLRGSDLVRSMKESFSGFVENGGGHARAAAFRISEGYERSAVEEIIKILSSY